MGRILQIQSDQHFLAGSQETPATMKKPQIDESRSPNSEGVNFKILRFDIRQSTV